MKDKEKYLEMIAPCGYYCYGCPAYVNTTCTDEVVADNMAKRANVSIKNIRMCEGCRATNGKPHGSLCPTYDCCVNQKQLDFCYECEDFPCLKLAPISQGADVRTHNSKIYNLLMLKKLGMDAYIEKGKDWWILYARGKSPIPGDDPQIQRQCEKLAIPFLSFLLEPFKQLSHRAKPPAIQNQRFTSHVA